MTTPLLDVKTFVLSEDVLGWTLDVLAKIGRNDLEGFVVWAGVFEGADTFRYRSAHHPPQHATSGPKGCLVTVAGSALFELNRTAFAAGEVLAGQVHTHPTDAFHSDTDDCFPLVNLPGAVSVVVHDFARHGRRQSDRWAWYRLQSTGRWAPLASTAEVVLE